MQAIEVASRNMLGADTFWNRYRTGVQIENTRTGFGGRAPRHAKGRPASGAVGG